MKVAPSCSPSADTVSTCEQTRELSLSNEAFLQSKELHWVVQAVEWQCLDRAAGTAFVQEHAAEEAVCTHGAGSPRAAQSLQAAVRTQARQRVHGGRMVLALPLSLLTRWITSTSGQPTEMTFQVTEKLADAAEGQVFVEQRGKAHLPNGQDWGGGATLG